MGKITWNNFKEKRKAEFGADHDTDEFSLKSEKSIVNKTDGFKGAVFAAKKSKKEVWIDGELQWTAESESTWAGKKVIKKAGTKFEMADKFTGKIVGGLVHAE